MVKSAWFGFVVLKVSIRFSNSLQFDVSILNVVIYTRLILYFRKWYSLMFTIKRIHIVK